MARSLLLLVAVLSGCSSPDPLGASCMDAVRAPLVNAAVGETYLGLAAAELRAIVEVTNGAEGDGPLCSGAFVAPDWVVTAAHCLVIDSPHVVVPVEGSSGIVARVVEQAAHPDLDVALLKVEVPKSDAAFEPLGAAAAGSRVPVPGDVVELAGYGLTEAGGTHGLRFLAEVVTAVDGETIVVNGFGANGACDGDSGGPILVRGARGAVTVTGVLSKGSASCLEHDRYVRLDTLAAWVDAVTGGYVSRSPECGSIEPAGRCLYGTALFCDGEKRLVTETCTGRKRCGYSAGDGGFRCIEPDRDPCEGVDSFGACRSGVALVCNEGTLEESRCDCGQQCRIDGRTGKPRCGEL